MRAALSPPPGTQGMKVTIWTFPGFWERAAEEAVRALEKLGLPGEHSGEQRISTPYFALSTDKRTRGVQAGMMGWFDLPRAASFLLTADSTCASSNLSFFCNAAVDAEIARALKVEATDPDAASALWARIEHDVVDLAPQVPLFTPSHLSIVSKRVGNYQYNPEWEILFDQLWVR